LKDFIKERVALQKRLEGGVMFIDEIPNQLVVRSPAGCSGTKRRKAN
jgi:hypothetical protein